MEFTLHYRGALRANRRPPEKHKIRKLFHVQLKKLWEEHPLDEVGFLLVPNSIYSIIIQSNKYNFAPIVNSKLHLVADLKITLLRPGPPGSIVSQSGDLDNRLKTLLDALKMPSEPNEIPSGDLPTEDEDPFFCLLEDDSLITGISIETDRLLEPVLNDAEVILLIKVKVEHTKSIYANVGVLT